MVVVITSTGGVTKRVISYDDPVDAGLVNWAHSYLKATSGSKQSQGKTAQKEKHLKSNASAEEKKKLSDERKAEKQALSDQKKELKFLQTLEKHLQRMK